MQISLTVESQHTDAVIHTVTAIDGEFYCVMTMRDVILCYLAVCGTVRLSGDVPQHTVPSGLLDRLLREYSRYTLTHIIKRLVDPTVEKSVSVLSVTWRSKYLAALTSATKYSSSVLLTDESDNSSCPAIIRNPIAMLEADPYLALWGRKSHWLCSASARRKTLLHALKQIIQHNSMECISHCEQDDH